jgi:hypothetical protein
METEGQLAPATRAEARRAYAELAPAARTVTRATVRALGLDREEYDDRGADAAAAARDALFGSLLEVRVGTREEFEAWREGFDGQVQRLGSENVPNAVWHVVPFGLPGDLPDGPPDGADGEGMETDPDAEPEPLAVVATFQDEREAAVSTLRRTVFGRVYREVIHADPVETGAHTAVPPEEETDTADEGEDEA